MRSLTIEYGRFDEDGPSFLEVTLLRKSSPDDLMLFRVLVFNIGIWLYLDFT